MLSVEGDMMKSFPHKTKGDTMKKIIPMCVAVLTLFAVSYAHSGKHEGNAKFTKHFNETLFAISEKGQMSIEVLLDEKEYKIGKDMIGIVVHNSHDEDVEGAKLEVTGAAGPLAVTEKGGGLYLVPAAGMPMEGKWELKIAVKKKEIDDSASFTFPGVLSKKMPAGKYDAEGLKGK
jgi:hypothetical protein